MKFNTNLQQLRKKKGLSQEALAEQLEVTRQSVSKWESGASYPEMDKLLMMCKIFKVDLDTLINGDVLVEEQQKKETMTGKDILNTLDQFMKKVIYFFDHMSAKDLLSFLVSMVLIVVLVALIRIPFELVSDFVYQQIFMQLGETVGGVLGSIWHLLTELIYVCFALAIVFYFIKLKYIDHVTIEVIEEEEKITIKEENDNVQIREIPVRASAASEFLTQMIVYFLKFIAICFLFGIGICLVVFAGLVGFSICFAMQGLPTIGISLGLLGVLGITAMVFLIPFNFVINHKNSFKTIGITLLVSFVFLIGGSLSFALETMEITYYDKVPSYAKEKEATFTLPMSESLDTAGIYSDITYQEDNTLTDTLSIHVTYYDFLDIKMKVDANIYNDSIHLQNSDEDVSFNVGRALKTIGADLKKKELYNYHRLTNMKVTIRTSRENIEKLNRNTLHSYHEENYDYEDQAY